MSREYFSERAGRTKPGTITKEDIKIIFEALYNQFENKGYFQYYFGKKCVDIDHYTLGKAEMDIKQKIAIRFGTERKLNPTSENIRNFSSDDVFDLVEFLHDYIAKPTSTHNHNWNGCGLHVDEASVEQGQADWTAEWNLVLARLDPPYRLTNEGTIEVMPSSEGLKQLVDDRKLYGDTQNVDAKVDRACHLYLGRNATLDDKRDALRELADVLEFLRSEVRKKLPSKEASDLFDIANNYGIRHHNTKQRTDYNREAYYPWIFQSYLATIDLLARLKEEGKK
jgi:hypothetical protein